MTNSLLFFEFYILLCNLLPKNLWDDKIVIMNSSKENDCEKRKKCD